VIRRVHDLALDPAQRSDVLSADQCLTELH
jgi:hypothetical protein